MKKIRQFAIISSIMIIGSIIGCPVAASEKPLFLAYPPDNHQTTAKQIFLIGTASEEGEVLVNGKPIARSKNGNFAPNFPLQIGVNNFVLRYQNQEIQIKVMRTSSEPIMPVGIAFANNSLTPAQDISRLPNELICFAAIAPPEANVLVKLGNQNISLLPQPQVIQLPANSAILNADNQPITSNLIGQYRGCTQVSEIGNLGYPIFQLSLQGKTITQQGSGKIDIISPQELEVIEVTATTGVTRTGPSTDYSRLTPLPKGTKASITGKEGDWFRLDYGAWINSKDTQLITNTMPPHSLIRSITSRQIEGATEIIFPLEVPIPISVQQGEKTFTLTLYNTTAQTDTIYLNDNPIIKRLDWQQITPNKVEYTFNLKSEQQWGYDVRYEGTSLVLSLRHPPKLEINKSAPLTGIKILLDPGHGGKETGAKGPNNYPEKDVNLVVSKLLQKELVKRGATVYMTREIDKDLSLQERVNLINIIKPTIAISIHYNALPDGGNAINTSGVAAFWYHPQAHDLSGFLHNYLVAKLNRPSYGVFWNNLAMTRPSIIPSVLLELGFMINPDEFEWVTNPEQQDKLAKTLADGLTEWFYEKLN